MSYNMNGLLNSDGSVTQYGNTKTVGSGGGGDTGDYPDLTNKPSINGVELLGNKVIGLLSTNIQVDSDKIGYNNLTSGLSATNVKSALDEIVSERTAITENVNDYLLQDGQTGDGFLLKKGAQNGTISLYSSAVSSQGVILKDESSQTNLPPVAAVQYVQDNFQPQVSADTTDITAGTTPLATGNIYLVYE